MFSVQFHFGYYCLCQLPRLYILIEIFLCLSHDARSIYIVCKIAAAPHFSRQPPFALPLCFLVLDSPPNLTSPVLIWHTNFPYTYTQAHFKTTYNVFFHRIMVAEKIIFLQMYNTIFQGIKWFLNVKMIHLEKIKGKKYLYLVQHFPCNLETREILYLYKIFIIYIHTYMYIYIYVYVYICLSIKHRQCIFFVHQSVYMCDKSVLVYVNPSVWVYIFCFQFN